MGMEIRHRRLVSPLAVAAGAVLAALTLFTAAGVFVAPLILRPVAEQRLGRWLGRQVKIDRIRVNPLALSMSVDKFEVLEADGRTAFVSLRRLYVNAELASVLRRAVVVREIRFESPRVHIERRQAPASGASGGSVYNFSDIVTRLAGPTKAPEAPAKGGGVLPRFSLNNIRVLDGELVFDDLPVGGHHEITGFTLGLPFLSTLLVDVDTFVAPGLSGRVDGRPFTVSARTKPFKDTTETVVALRLDALDVTRYLAYSPVPLPVTVSSALLTVALDISFLRPRAAAHRLSFAGKILLEDTLLRESDAEHRPLLALRRLNVTVANADVSARRFAIDRVLVSGLDANVRRFPDGTLNLQRLLPRTANGGAAAESTPELSIPEDQTRFEVDAFQVEDAAVHFRDESVSPPFESSIEDLSVLIEHLSNTQGGSATMAVTGRASPGGSLAGRGRLSIAPLASTGTLSLDGFEPGAFSSYFSERVAFEVANGRANLGVRYELAEKRDRVSLRLRDGFVKGQDVVLRLPRTRKELLRVPRFAARGVDADLDNRTLAIAELTTEEGSLRIGRDERGVVDLATLVERAPTAVNDPGVDSTWAVSMARLDAGGWSVRFDDRAVNPPTVTSLAPLSLHATSLSNVPGRRGDIDLRLGVNKRGRLALAGPVGLAPATADLRVDLRRLDVVPFRPYLRELFDPDVTKGLASFKGRARIGGSAPPIRLTGDVDLTDFAVTDRANKEELLRWSSFHVGGLDISTTPVSVDVREAELKDFDVRLIVFPNGKFNFASAPGRPPRPAAKPLRLPEKIAIGQVKLAGGKVVFTDRMIRPNASTALTDLAGSVTGLSSVVGTRAVVDIRGRLDRSGLLTIAGKINPLAKDLFVDLRGDVKDFDLVPASPYAATYLGYGIKQGKLSLAVEYHVARRMLAAHNRVIVDQLVFGDKVRSPDAVKVPLKLAVSLLTDRRGVIDIELPVSGSLDDPDFNVWRAIQRELRDRVVEAATAPFSYLAKTFGGSDQVASVMFPAGLAHLDEKGRNRLANLAKALHERPQLSFEIQGGADPQKDRDGLRRELLERKLRAQKRAELVRAGVAVGDVDEVRFDASERSRLLAAAYQAETFPKPRNIIGFVRRLPAEEMERLMLANIKVDNEALRALARRRAAVVKAALAESAPAGAARLFLISPRTDRGASVDFRLKSD